MADRWWESAAVADKPAKADDWWAEATPEQPTAAPARAAVAAALARPTGEVHDGDTFRLDNGQNARLYGADAFELKQTGRTRNGATVPLGRQARDTLAPFAVPAATVTPTGASTYGRPVASLDNGGDAAEALLRQGYGLATPEYLKRDPARLGDYMEAERDARLNRRGAWAGSFEQPWGYRHGTANPWDTAAPGKPGETQAVFWDEPLPAQGLRPDIAEGWLALHKAPGTTEADILAYAKANGFQIDPTSAARFIRERDARPGAAVNDTLQYRDLPRVITDPKDGATGSALRGFADPVNVLDEMGAFADTLVPGSGRENLWSSDRRFGDVYANNLDQNRSVLAYDDANHPYARFGGQLVGGLVMPGASVEGVGFRAASDVLRAGGTRFAAEQAARRAVVTRLGAAGAAEGTAAGVGQGEDWQGRVTGGLIGAPVGLALGTGLGLAAPALAKAVGRPFSKLAGREGERAAESFTDGAIDTTRARLSNDLSAPPSRSPDRLDLTVDPARQPDRLAMSPMRAAASEPIEPAPVATAPTIYPPLPPKTIAEVSPELRAWAERQGAATSSSSADLPAVMLHGSPRPDIDAFDPYGKSGYGLFGTGTYLTDSADIAAEYTSKGLNRIKSGADQTLYAVRQAVKNPLDMDAPADLSSWNAAASRVLGEDGFFDDAPAGATNESLWRTVEEHLMGEQVYASDGQETMDALVRSLGHDGITHIGGGRINKNGARHRVVIALDPEQTEIVDRMSLGSMLKQERRNPDWIDIGVRPSNDADALPRLPAYAQTRTMNESAAVLAAR